MPVPRLTFFCELESNKLQALFAGRSVIEDLRELRAGISLGLVDLSQERAGVVRQLNEAGIPVIAWLLLEKEKGYWCCLDNIAQTRARYEAFLAWTRENGLKWAGLGLDIEPDIREVQALAGEPWRLLPRVLRRAIDYRWLPRAQSDYRELAQRIGADGFHLESYQFPLIADERKVGSTLLRRVSGLVDLPVNREVWMLYSSFYRPYGVGYLWSYAPEAAAIAVGSTGGGTEGSGLGDPRPMTWEELARDLRLAWYWSDDIYIFSLEGCLRQGFMEPLKSFAWDVPILFPEEPAETVGRWRGTLQSALWMSKNLPVILVGAFTSWFVVSRLRRLAERGGQSG